MHILNLIRYVRPDKTSKCGNHQGDEIVNTHRSFVYVFDECDLKKMMIKNVILFDFFMS